MRLEITTVNGRSIDVDNVTQAVLCESADAACSSLSVTFKSKSRVDEIVSVTAFIKDKKVFFGYCDCQKISADKNGFENYFYARSSACLLVDSQSKPFTFVRPTARQLYINYAREFGFKYRLGDISSNDKYEILPSTSCYGAINNFVSLIYGENIYITPDNEIVLLSPEKEAKSFDGYNIASAKAVINRSEPLSQINFKRNVSSDYNIHTKSVLAEEMALKRERYVNLSTLPRWQREYTVLKKLKKSFDEYRLLEIVLHGYCDISLYQKFDYESEIGHFEGYIVTDKKYSFSENGEQTRLVLKKRMTIGDVTYVA